MTFLSHFKSMSRILNHMGVLPFTVEGRGSELELRPRYVLYCLKLISIDFTFVYLLSKDLVSIESNDSMLGTISMIRTCASIVGYNAVTVWTLLSLKNHFRMMRCIDALDRKFERYSLAEDLRETFNLRYFYGEAIFGLGYTLLVYLIHVYYEITLAPAVYVSRFIQIWFSLWPQAILIFHAFYLKSFAGILRRRYDKMTELFRHFRQHHSEYERNYQLDMLQFIVEFLNSTTRILKIFNQTFGLTLLIVSTNVFIFSAVMIYIVITSVSALTAEGSLGALYFVFNNVFILPFPLKMCLLCFAYQALYDTTAAACKDVMKLPYNENELYDNYIDLVNMKIESSKVKVTACDLFVIDVQLFYNIFGAIVTYILILFQFKAEEVPAES